MNILGLSTSPRIGGNTEILIDELLRGAQEKGGTVEKIQTARLNIRPCRHCDDCLAYGICSVSDDMGELYPKIKQCDCLVFASPIFFMGLCGQGKLIVDRCQAFWVSSQILKQKVDNREVIEGVKRRGVFISVGATHGPKVFAGVKETMKWFFKALEMEYWGELLFEGIDTKEAIRDHQSALGEAYQMGQSLVECYC